MRGWARSFEQGGALTASQRTEPCIRRSGWIRLLTQLQPEHRHASC